MALEQKDAKRAKRTAGRREPAGVRGDASSLNRAIINVTPFLVDSRVVQAWLGAERPGGVYCAFRWFAVAETGLAAGWVLPAFPSREGDSQAYQETIRKRVP